MHNGGHALVENRFGSKEKNKANQTINYTWCKNDVDKVSIDTKWLFVQKWTNYNENISFRKMKYVQIVCKNKI